MRLVLLHEATDRPAELVAGIEARLVADLFYHAKGVIAGTLVLIAVNLAFYYDLLPPLLVGAWLLLLLSSCAIRWTSLRRFERAEGTILPQRWHFEVALAYAVMAAGWGLLGVSSVLFLPSTQSIVAVVTVAGITGSAAATTSASPIVFKLVAYIALAPLALTTLFSSQEALPYVGAMTGCYLAVLNRASRRIHETLLQSVTFGLENDELVRSLALQSTIDPLTGLPNRRALNQGFQEAWKNAAVSQGGVGLILCDIDHFKEYNDTYGHLAGDKCLQRVAQVLQSETRSGDVTTARYGGEEFAVLLPNCASTDLERVGERLRAAVEALAIPHRNSPVSPSVTMSVGAAALLPVPSTDVDSLIRAADDALYKAKKDGRNCLQVDLPNAAA